jgi:transposase
VSHQAASIADKDARIAELEAALAARDTLIDTLRFQLAQLKRMTFGQSSEKLVRHIEQLELTLEELEGEAEVADAWLKESPAVADRPAPVRALPDHLPRTERRIEPDAGSCTCPACGGALRPLSEDHDEMLDVAPVQWRVVRTIRPKYSCRACEKVVQAPAAVKAIARGRATFATLAHVVVHKFDHHLPLYRQAEMMAAQGIDIDRATLAGWAGQAAHLLDPIISRIREQGLKADKIHADDTPVPMLVPGKGKTAQARLWAYVVDDRASGATTPPLVWYRFTPDRSGIHPQTELKDFTGLLQADAYAGFDKLYQGNRISEIACWAHVRRKIFDNHATSPTPLATDLLDRIAGLYKIEDAIRGEPPDRRRAVRHEQSKPQVEMLRLAIDDALRRLSPKSAMAKALAYGRKRWEALTRYLDDGRAEMDNNIAERAIRAIAIGRKNWLFAGSTAGGERAAALYTVIETAKLNGLEPQAYIADVIEKIAQGWPASHWDELMPWNWSPPQAQIAQAA